MKHIEFIEGAIPGNQVQQSIEAMSANTEVGGIDIFIGNVRADKMDGSHVSAIQFTHEAQLANNQLNNIVDEATAQYNCKNVIVLHSLGTVRTGEMCMVVITGCRHRAEAYDSNRDIVERLKKEVPIWGKEIAASNEEQWKVNTD